MLKFHKEILKQFEPVGKKAKIILFGSLAKGNYKLDSDIDLAIITKNKNLMKLASCIADKILSEQGKLVTLKFINEKDFEEGKSPLISEIKKGIVIYNGENVKIWLRILA
ncbi:MAG: nucleotidyltransferase domain-containing protein [Candidatus Bathyarchaeota archaeon]|jgi:predicted nucleotidyltransferase|nr:nucleotidyltransferase domain-containing protein [Candidatus Bathyarchaeota archaeon]